MKNLGKPVYYHEYLRLDNILNSQELESNPKAHDEMLFIIVHQAYELWFKQILHELNSVIEIFKNEYVNEELIGIAVSRLSRITEIQKVLLEQFRILETMTPLDFLDFRDFLFPASGFQSLQFRIIENKLGLKPDKRILYNERIYSNSLNQEHKELINKLEKEDSLYELIEKWLERIPFIKLNNFDFLKSYKKAVEKMLNSDKKLIESHPTLNEEEKSKQLEELNNTKTFFNAIFNKEIHNEFVKDGKKQLSYEATYAALFINLYRDEPILHLPFMLLTRLIEIDELFCTWRYRHSIMVNRMIGTKIGTGGSSGYNYLKSTIDSHKIFNDFFNLSTYLIPRSILPPLPKEIKKQLGYFFSNE